jgi:hypothetical protein
LKDLDFNNEARLESLFYVNYSIHTNRSSGRITLKIPFLEPNIDVRKSREATHIRVIAVAAAINFSKAAFINDYAATDYISLDLNTITDIRLSLTLPAPVIHRFL